MQIPNEKRIAIEHRLNPAKPAVVTAAAACLTQFVDNDDLLAAVMSSPQEDPFHVLLLTARHLVAGTFPDSQLTNFRNGRFEMPDLALTVTPLGSLREVEMLSAGVWSADGDTHNISARYRLHFTGRDPIDVPPVGRYDGSVDSQVEAFMDALLQHWPPALAHSSA